MVFTLQAKQVKYSARERRIFGLLPQNGDQISSDVLIERFWHDDRAVPYFRRNTVMGTLRSLRAKVIRNQEDFVINTSEPSGPKPQVVWLSRN